MKLKLSLLTVIFLLFAVNLCAGNLGGGGITRHLRLVLVDPNTLTDTTLCLDPAISGAITVTQLDVTCDLDPATEITGDLKWADAFIGLANATVINDFDTTDGVRTDSSITAGAVAAGKCLYIQFSEQPAADIGQITFKITYVY